MSQPELVVRLDQTDHEIKILMNSPDTQIPVMMLAERGPTGLKGDKGDNGSAEQFVHTQTVAATEWIVNHNFGQKPIADVLSVGGKKIGAAVIHTSVNQLRVYFNTPQTGEVVCI